MMKLEQIFENKKQYLDLLLLADEQEDMIDRYLDRGEMFLLKDRDIKAVAVVTAEGPDTCELKNLAVLPAEQRRGYGRKMIELLCARYAGHYRRMLVGTGEAPGTMAFYKRCGFAYSHRIPDFFTKNYAHPIWEDGVLLKDMIYFVKKI